MILNPWDYLLRLSVLAVSFVGFSAIVVTLCRALGGELSAHHRYTIRLLIELGLAVAAFAILPGALSFTGLADSTVWRLSSAAAALIASVQLTITTGRRRRPAPGPAPRVIVNNRLFILGTLALWVNTVGFRFQPIAAPYVLALALFLGLG